MPIFSGLQQRQSKKTTDVKHPSVTIIQSATTLLAAEKRQKHLQNIKSLLNLPPKLYHRLYYQVIEQFAEFVQSLPETAHGIFANEVGFLDHGLERASRALSLCLAYFFPQEKNLQSITSQQALWVYAVFTAALLYDIGKLAVKYKIDICQKDGTTIQTWSPYTCSMVAQGKYYKYEFVKENRDNLRRLVTALLARQILAEAEVSGESDAGSTGGFNWIASNPDVLEAWLALLNGNTRTVNSFMTVIPLADMQVIESNFHNIKGFGSQLPGMFSNLPGIGEDTFGLSATNEAFLEWLRNGLADNSISVNQDNSHVHTTLEGIVVLSSIFNQYLSENPQVKQSHSEIARQFRNFLDLYQMSIGEQIINQRHHSGTFVSIEKNQAYLINNDYLLFTKAQIPATFSSTVQVQNIPNTVQSPTVQTHVVQSPTMNASTVQSPTGHISVSAQPVVTPPKPK